MNGGEGMRVDRQGTQAFYIFFRGSFFDGDGRRRGRGEGGRWCIITKETDK